MSFELRRAYLAEMAHIQAEQMVFLDESLFNEVTGWRLMAWASIGVEGRYLGDRTRGSTWSVLAAYSIIGYLSCVVVREVISTSRPSFSGLQRISYFTVTLIRVATALLSWITRVLIATRPLKTLFSRRAVRSGICLFILPI
jgi:hypothetical protein